METNLITIYKNNCQQRPKAVFCNNTQNLPQVKKGIILTASTAGMLVSLAMCGKAQKLNILHLNELSKLDIGAKEILTIASGSVIGGLISGTIVDKKNAKNKLRESFQQIIGNVFFPVSFVSIANWLYGKTTIQKHIPKVNNRIINAFVQAFPATLITIFALISGIITGNKVTCKANDKLFNKKENRSIKVTDFAAHIDDICLGATLVAKNLSANSTSLVGSIASKLVPPALIVPGYMTGIASNKTFD